MPLLVFESIYFIVLFIYFLFTDIKDVAMVGFYGYEIVCLVIFGTTAIVLLIFFLPKDPFLIVEIILMTFLIIIDGVIIALEFVDMDGTTSTQTYVFL